MRMGGGLGLVQGEMILEGWTLEDSILDVPVLTCNVFEVEQRSMECDDWNQRRKGLWTVISDELGPPSNGDARR